MITHALIPLIHSTTYFFIVQKLKYILTLQAQCCGVGTSNVMSMTGSSWFTSNRDSSYQQIPVQCCKSQTVVYPYASKTDTDCTNSTITGLYHTQVCKLKPILRNSINCMILYYQHDNN